MMKFPHHTTRNLRKTMDVLTMYFFIFLFSLSMIMGHDSIPDSIPIHYPKHILSRSHRNWRSGLQSNFTAIRPEHEFRDEKFGLSLSRNDNDVFLYENFFYGLTRGVIVEAGGFDGLFESNSFFFEKALGWVAVHIEADLENFADLVKNRPRSINVNSALCHESATLHFATGKRTTGGIVEFMSDSYKKGWHKELADHPEKVQDLRQVQCIEMYDVMLSLGIHRIDVFVLDVEGGEEEVLKGMDFKKIKVHIVVIENDGHDENRDLRKIGILKKNGFECLIKRMTNVICVNKAFKRFIQQKPNITNATEFVSQ